MTAKKRLTLSIILTLISLSIIDVIVSLSITGLGFNVDAHSNPIKRYFSYGTSISRKLETLVGTSDETSALISQAGWNPILPARTESKSADCRVPITMYGMSFSNRIAKHMAELDPCVAIRTIAGPGAPLSHSYYNFQRFDDQDDSSVVVMAVLASSLPKINTVAHLNSSFEYPGAHIFPRYSLDKDTVISSGVPANSLSEFRSLLNSPDKQELLLKFMLTHDAFYDELVYGHQWADYSSTLKMLRRSYAGKKKREIKEKFYKSNQFLNNQNMINVSRALITEFAKTVRSHGDQPIILLINDRGYAKSLDLIFIKELTKSNIPFITSTNYIDSNNLNNFETDGHFTNQNDVVLAQSLLNFLKEH